jgi:hypothetical protein
VGVVRLATPTTVRETPAGDGCRGNRRPPVSSSSEWPVRRAPVPRDTSTADLAAR